MPSVWKPPRRMQSTEIPLTSVDPFHISEPISHHRTHFTSANPFHISEPISHQRTHFTSVNPSQWKKQSIEIRAIVPRRTSGLRNAFCTLFLYPYIAAPCLRAESPVLRAVQLTLPLFLPRRRKESGNMDNLFVCLVLASRKRKMRLPIAWIRTKGNIWKGR